MNRINANPIDVTKFKPTLDWVLIERDEVGARTASGLYTAPSTQRNAIITSCNGTVVAVGPGGFSKSGSRQAMSVQPGDRVIFDRKKRKKFHDEDVILVRDDDILAIRS